ncbi:hypothetical protein ACFL57_02810 [Candidatus Margulisiibacteriota bacterium]
MYKIILNEVFKNKTGVNLPCIPIDKKTQQIYLQGYKALNMPAYAEKRTYGNKCYSFCHRLGLLSPEVRTSHVEKLQDYIYKTGLPLSASASCRKIHVTHQDANKAAALSHFANMIGVKIGDIIKIADSSFKYGTDQELLIDKNSFNVGKERAFHPDVNNIEGTGQAWIESLFNRIDSIGVKALALDMFGVFVPYDTEIAAVYDYYLQKINSYLKAGIKVAIITGGGVSADNLIRTAFNNKKLSTDGNNNLILYLYQGGLGIAF